MSEAKWQVTRFQQHGLRIISLNCGAEATAQAGEEVAQYSPDIVFFQESPGPDMLDQLSRRLYGPDALFAYYPDCGIIARGELVRRFKNAPGQYVALQLRLPDKKELALISLHTVSPVRHRDIISPTNFREQTENRQERREQLKVIASQISRIPANLPIIVGGDFNAPQGDAIYRYLQPRLHDTFKIAGIGWGNTVFNEHPFLRIDEIWTSDDFKVISVRAAKTKHSDHRMVICDLLPK
jgi:endonuclease/exonuclease/phosphatase (EEP) superfamily protein YafD